jgi:hypothetical protein
MILETAKRNEGGIHWIALLAYYLELKGEFMGGRIGHKKISPNTQEMKF